MRSLVQPEDTTSCGRLPDGLSLRDEDLPISIFCWARNLEADQGQFCSIHFFGPSKWRVV